MENASSISLQISFNKKEELPRRRECKSIYRVQIISVNCELYFPLSRYALNSTNPIEHPSQPIVILINGVPSK